MDDSTLSSSTFLDTEDNQLYSLKMDENISDKVYLQKVLLTDVFSFYWDDSKGLTILIKNEELEGGITYPTNTIFLSKCKDGLCSKIQGYIIYSNDKVLMCEKNSSYCESALVSDCLYSARRFIIEDNTVKMCIKNKNGEYSSVAINIGSNNNNILCHYSDNDYNLYKSNENGYIIYRSDEGDFYFYFIIDTKNIIHFFIILFIISIN